MSICPRELFMAVLILHFNKLTSCGPGQGEREEGEG